jgi:hypothetical protein
LTYIQPAIALSQNPERVFSARVDPLVVEDFQGIIEVIREILEAKLIVKTL